MDCEIVKMYWFIINWWLLKYVYIVYLLKLFFVGIFDLCIWIGMVLIVVYMFVLLGGFDGYGYF